ncbi:MAG TPA: response regulator [Candidatus Acidoferrales bacterium]|nr:response regulator [Candidatus Acidoferrales bacterium]
MKKILIAEDNPANSELMLEVLSGRGYELLEASDGRQALQKIEETEPDLVLLDIQLPILDDFAVLFQLRQNPRFANIRVVAVTANAMKEDREKSLRAGFNAYISKPIDAAALRLLVDQLLLKGP